MGLLNIQRETAALKIEPPFHGRIEMCLLYDGFFSFAVVRQISIDTFLKVPLLLLVTLFLLQLLYSNIENTLHLEISAEQKSNADSVNNLVRYGIAGGSDGWIPGVDVPFIGADGFCSPIGSGWESRVTSEFGNRIDPITGKRKGHTGMDLAVPTGTPIRAALSGTVTVSKYNAGGYGYYVMIDHGNGLTTLYGHCSQLLARVGQTVQAGDIIALSGSTGRSTGPHLHFEVRVNGERTNPRAYLPKG